MKGELISKMKRLLWGFFLVPNILLSQSIECSLIKSNHLNTEGLSFNPELRSFVLDCFNRLNVSPPQNLHVYESNIKNCMVTFRQGFPTMVIDPNWLNLLRSGDDWHSVFVIGHEIGHLMEGHLGSMGDKRHEYEADIWDARLILAFDYPFDNFNDDYPAGLLKMPDSESHPSGLKRLNHINWVLSKSDRSILSRFGAFEFQIDKWSKSASNRYNELEQSFERLESNLNKKNLIRVIENLNYCRRDFGLQTDGNVISLLAYGMMIELLTTQEAFDYLKNSLTKKTSREYGPDIFTLFNHDINYHYFSELIPLIDIKYFREVLYANSASDYLKINTIKMLLGIFLNEENHRDVLIGFDFHKALSKLETADNLRNPHFLNTLMIYTNYIGNYEKSLKLATEALEIQKDWYSKNHYIGAWNKEMLGLGHYNVGLCLFRLKSFSTSIRSLELSLSYLNTTLNINSSRALLSRCFLAIGEFDKALAYIGENDNIKDASELKVRGQIFLANGQVQKAIRAFERSCELKNRWSCTKLLQLR